MYISTARYWIIIIKIGWIINRLVIKEIEKYIKDSSSKGIKIDKLLGEVL